MRIPQTMIPSWTFFCHSWCWCHQLFGSHDADCHQKTSKNMVFSNNSLNPNLNPKKQTLKNSWIQRILFLRSSSSKDIKTQSNWHFRRSCNSWTQTDFTLCMHANVTYHCFCLNCKHQRKDTSTTTICVASLLATKACLFWLILVVDTVSNPLFAVFCTS